MPTASSLLPSFGLLLILLSCSTHVLNWKDGVYYFPPEQKETFLKSIRTDYLGRIPLRLHTVTHGESFWAIAKKYKVHVNVIFWSNPFLKTYLAYLGQKIVVPEIPGALHYVQEGETLSLLALRYDVRVQEIKMANDLPFLSGLFENLTGKVLFVPIENLHSHKIILVTTENMHMLAQMRDLFISPLGNPDITRTFGLRKDPFQGTWKKHKGIDLAAPLGAPVTAAASGRVIYSGWLGGYGKAIKIAHSKGYSTLYGHLSRIFVKYGTKVYRGQIIGRCGKTGRATGPHVHFEIFRGRKTIDPLSVLW